MNRLILFLLILFTAAACKNELHNQIYRYERQVNSITVKKIVALGNFEPFLASDSIALTKWLYDSVYAEKLAALQLQLNELQSQFSRANTELETIKNPYMYAPFKKQADKIKLRADNLEKVLNIYKTHPEQTGLQTYKVLIAKYSENPDSLLGYTLQGAFKGVEGDLTKGSFKRTYFFDGTKTQISAYN